jgi:DNA mismatch repair protein MutS2
MDFSVDALEYHRLKDLLGRFVSTASARQALEALSPLLDLEKLDNEHAITAEAMQYLREHRVPFNDIALLAQAIDKHHRRRSVWRSMRSRRSALSFHMSKACGSAGKRSAKSFPDCRSSATVFPTCAISQSISAKRFRNGEIDENYSPELRRIRRAIALARSRLTDKLESILRSPAYSSQLQEEFITIRNGRFVIPVRRNRSARSTASFTGYRRAERPSS